MELTRGEIVNDYSFYLILLNNLELAIRFISNLINAAFERVWLKWQLQFNTLYSQLFVQLKLFVK